jgi:hypothetical protein
MRQTKPPYNSGLLRRSRYCATLPPAGVQVREVFAAPEARSEAANSTGPSSRRSGFVALATSGRMRRQQEHDARASPAAHTPRRRTLGASSHARLIRARRIGGVDRRWKARRRGFRRRRRCRPDSLRRQDQRPRAPVHRSSQPVLHGPRAVRIFTTSYLSGFWSRRHRPAEPLPGRRQRAQQRRERGSGLHIPRRRRLRCVSRSIWSAPRLTQFTVTPAVSCREHAFSR